MIDFKDRIMYLDILRSLAIIFIIVWHLSLNFTTNLINWEVVVSTISIVRVGIPLFIMISGALILNRKHENVYGFIKRKIKRLFTPYFLWAIIFFILGLTIIPDSYGLFVQDTPANLSIAYFLSVLSSLSAFSSILWFILYIFGFYLVTPILDAFIREYDLKGIEYMLIIAIICAIIPTLRLEDSIIFDRIRYLSLFFLSYFYPLLGYYLHKKEFNISDKYLLIIGIILLILGYVLSFNYIYGLGIEKLTIHMPEINSWYVMLEAAGLFLIAKYANVKMISNKLKPIKNTRFAKFIVSLSICSFGMYFVHWILINYLGKQQFFIQFTLGKAYYWIPVFGICLIFISWIIVLILSKIPVLKWFSGV